MIKTPTNGTPKAAVITEPKFSTASFLIEGTAPLVLHRFSEKTRRMLEQTMEAGGAKNTRGRIRDPRDFDADCEAATYYAAEGWCGIPAASFRNAMVSACKVCGFAMTRAKLTVFVVADGFDREDGTPLVRITKGEHNPWRSPVRNDTGVVDIRSRPMWREGWEAVVNVEFDAQQFTVVDVSNLMARSGLQVGVGEGRPDSPNSTGLGFGRWKVTSAIASLVKNAEAA